MVVVVVIHCTFNSPTMAQWTTHETALDNFSRTTNSAVLLHFTDNEMNFSSFTRNETFWFKLVLCDKILFHNYNLATTLPRVLTTWDLFC